MELLKKKIVDIITTEQFCGICFENCEVNSIHSEYTIAGDYNVYHLILKDIIDFVFKSNISADMTSPYICDQCLTKIQDFYIFAINFESSSKIISKCIEELDYTTFQIDKEVCQSVAIILNSVINETNIANHFKCFVCNGLFISFAELNDHECKTDLDNNGDDINERNNSLKGINEKYNRITCTRSKRFTIHNLSCPVCNVKLKDKSDFTYHIDSHKKWICNLCNVEMPNYQKMKIHKRKAHIKRIQCLICSKDVRSIYLKQHMLIHQPQEVKYRCNNCNEIFTTKQSLKIHSQKHTESAPCPKCGKMIENGRMDRHLLYHNLREKQKTHGFPNSGFLCEYCDFKTNNTATLETHINQKHKKIKPYICAVCGQDFCGKFDLTRHMEIHSKSKQMKCEICGTIVSNKKCLIKHLRRHTGEKPYTCNHCGDAFITINILKIHKIKKHSKKTIACPLCGYMFHLLTDMRHHFKSVHWTRKDKRFDPRDVKELPKECYYLFEDQRRRKLQDDLELDN